MTPTDQRNQRGTLARGARQFGVCEEGRQRIQEEEEERQRAEMEEL